MRVKDGDPDVGYKFFEGVGQAWVVCSGIILVFLICFWEAINGRIGLDWMIPRAGCNWVTLRYAELII